MNKILKPYTIIPEELYVERDADKQIAHIIEDMGRPGYILVARQMGKTNLLINAKRKLETKDDIFAYIDLSNKFDNARECFRNIIDVIIDSNPDKLDCIQNELNEKRESIDVSPHKEHSRELRCVLKRIKGKLIVNLDEIDSLTAANYSDKIFAQVRSVYFERINFKEFERLSYILSGVADPSDIIKDRTISPFNIGQKIFLGDFKYIEYEWFIKKAKLQISDEIIKRIFYWVNGNPRMTWELCSEIEARISEGTTIDVSIVDSIVTDMYLTTFDRPPVNDIRSLVQSRKELREGVIAINYGRIETLTDEIKNRLYLAGILESGYESGDIKIKNKVIEKSLDDQWLKEIESENEISQEFADQCYMNGDYEKAIKLYEELVENKELNSDEILNINYLLGASYFNVGEYEKILNCYNEYMYDKISYKALYIEQLYLMGISYHKIGEVEKAKKIYLELIDIGENEKFYFESYVNLAAALLKENPIENRRKILELNEYVIDNYVESENSSKVVIASAYNNMANIAEIDGNTTEAIKLYMNASDVAQNHDKIAPLLSALKLDKLEGEKLFTKIVDVITSDEILKINLSSVSFLNFDRSTLLSLISIASERQYYKTLENLFKHIELSLVDDPFALASLILEAGIGLFAKSDTASAKYLLERLAKMDRAHVNADECFLGSKYLYYFSEDNVEAKNNYFQGYQNYIQEPDLIDVALFEREIINFSQKNEHDKSLSLANQILSSANVSSSNLKVPFLTISYFKMHCLNDESEKLENAMALKKFISTVNNNELKYTLLDENSLKQLKSRTNKFIVDLSPVIQRRNTGKKYGRNEKVSVKYTDGKIVTKKFKLVSPDLDAGLCSIVE